jgi:hypothetical protein
MKRLFLIATLFALAFSCDDSDRVNSVDCPQNIACTDIFISLKVEVKDAEGKPYSLAEYYTTKISTGEKISFQNNDTDQISRIYGAYTIFTDKHLKKTIKSGQEFEFIGIKDGKEVVRRKFVISHDCCHVKLVSGDTKITVK